MGVINIKKVIVIGVIVLFLGVGVQPAIATIEHENIDTEYYDVNIEFCEFGKNHTVQLTKQQLDELELLFDTIREQLNNTESIGETIQIYNEAIVELDNLGLLGGCSVRQVQELVTGEYQKPIFTQLMERMNDKNQVDDNINIFCLIAGRTTRTFVFPPSSLVAYRLFLFLDILENLRWYLFYYGFIRLCFAPLSPFTIGSGISLGTCSGWGYYLFPAEGWINTNGLYGEKNWEGEFMGGICRFHVFIDFVYLGVIGFKGLKIMDSNIENTYFYLGFANYVNI